VEVMRGGTRAISGGKDAQLRIWDLVECVLLYSFSQHTGDINGLYLMNGGEVTLSTSDDGSVCVWKWLEKTGCRLLGEEDKEKSQISNHHQPQSTRKSRKQQKDKKQQTEQQDHQDQHHRNGNETAEKATLTVLSIGSHDILVGSENGMIRHWNWKTGELMESLSSHGECVLDFVEVDDGVVISGGMDNDLRVWKGTVEEDEDDTDEKNNEKAVVELFTPQQAIEEVRRLLEIHKPSKLSNLPVILTKYCGREHELLRQIKSELFGSLI
jgi:WD40 repeat protein